MAAPPEVTHANLSGNWVLNRRLADDPDPMLALKDVPWLKRKIILLAAVTLSVKDHGGIQGTPELRVLDWSEIAHEDHIFGNLKSCNRWLADLKTSESGNGGPLHPYLTEGWLDEKVGLNREGFVQNWVVNEERSWTAEQIWGSACSMANDTKQDPSPEEGHQTDTDPCLWPEREIKSLELFKLAM